MNFKLYLKNKKGFSLIEILVVILISGLLSSSFVYVFLDLYREKKFFLLENNWQLDLYLAADFIAEKIKNSKKIEIIAADEIHLFTYYDDQYQWLKISQYKTKEKKNLGRAIGSNLITEKDFSKNLSLVDNLEEIKLSKVTKDLLKIELVMKTKKRELKVSKLVKI